MPAFPVVTDTCTLAEALRSLDSADADFTVLGKVGGKEQIESTISVTTVCDQWPDTTSTYWQGEQGKKGDVLCLKATK